MTVLIAAIAGGFIGAIPGFLRAYLGTSEVDYHHYDELHCSLRWECLDS